MRALTAIACLALLSVTFAGCADDAERYPDGVPSTSTSRSSSTSSSTSGTQSSTSTSTGPAGNGTEDGITANVTATPMNGTAPLNVTFTLSGNVTQGDLSWTFLFGDGNQTNGTELPATLVHEFILGGNYTPTLTVSNGTAEATASTNVTVDGGAAGNAPGLDPDCQRPDAVGNDMAFWADDRGGGSVWIYEESNSIPGLQLSMEPSPIPPPVGGHTDSLAIEHNCLNGDTMLF